MRMTKKIPIFIVLLFAICSLSSFNRISAQTIGVFITYGEESVSDIVVCQGTTIPLVVQCVGGSESGHTYTWTHDLLPTQVVEADDLFTIRNNATPGTYNLTVLVRDDGNYSGTASVSLTINASPLPVISANGNPIVFCEGENVELTETNIPGGSNISYQWQRNYSGIVGATSNTYVASISGAYRIKVTGENGCYKTSNTITVTAHPNPNATATSNSPLCDGETIDLTAGPGDVTSYSWASTAVTAFTSSTQNPSIAGANANNSGTYTVTVTDANGCLGTASTDVVVNAPVNAGEIGSAQTICYNVTPNHLTSISAASGGRGDFTYSWQHKIGAGSWSDISGETGLTLTLPALTQTTQYKRIATNVCGVVETAPITITVMNELNGGSIGSAQAICYNTAPSTFTSIAAASGGDNATWSYAWEYKVGAGEWTGISGSNNATYTAGSLITTTSYRRAATNATCGQTVYSNEITVTVHDELDGGTIAAAQSVCYGGDPDAFTATAATGGNGTTTYSWESKSSSGSVWTEVATTELYDVPAGITVSTDFRRIATNTCGTDESNVIVVTVHPQMNAGEISYTGGELCYNSDPETITSVQPATGGYGAWSYKWEYQSNCSGAWTEIAGATGTSYDPPANQTETRCYRRVATNATCGTVETAPVTITIKPDIDGGTISADQSVCYGDDPAAFASVAAATGGIGEFTYSWQSKTTGDWSTIAGATLQTYDAPANITQTTQYRRGATNTCGTAYSNEITVTVTDEVTGGTISEQEPICYNTAAATITGVTSPSGGTGTWVYQWEKKTDGAWSSIASSNSLTYSPGTLTQTTSFRRKATNDCGYAYSNEVEVAVWDELVNGSIVADQNICYNGDPALITSATLPSGGNTTTPYTYKWESQLNCSGAWVEIVGATSATYDPPANLTQNCCYRRVEIDECGTEYSNTVTVTVGVSLNPGTISGDQSICFGDDATILNNVTTAAGDGTLNYFWQKKTTGDWINIAASSASYTPPAGSVTETTIFRRGVTDNCNTEYSNEVTVTVNPLPVVTLSDFADVCIDGASVTLIGGAPAGGTYSGTGVSAGQFNPAVAGVGTHTITYLYNDGCTGSATNTITVNPLPTVFNITGGGNYCASNPTLEVGLDGSQNGVIYTLYKDGVATATTANGNGAAISFGIQTDAGVYTAEGQNATTLCLVAMAGSATLVQVPEISGNTITDNQTICSGSVPAQLNGSTPTGGDGAYTYQWFISNNGTTFGVIAGATSINYAPTAETSTKWYKRKVLSSTCESESNVIEITVNQPIAGNTVSQAQTICYAATPDELTGSLPTNGSGVYTYQWQSSTTGDEASFTDIAGATEQSYQPTALITDTWFRRVVTSLPCADNTSASIKITVNAEFSVQSVDGQNPTCNGGTNGEATVTLNGGVAPFSYSWDTNPVQTTAVATGLSANIAYSVTITDASTCVATGTITLSEPLAIALAEPIVSNQVAGCHGEAAGSIEVLAAGGTPNYTYTLRSGATIIDIQTPVHPAKAIFTSLAAGSYSVSITDANGCTPYVEDGIVITEPDELVINDVTTTPISCNGAADGTITIVAAGGTNPYEYSINGGFTFETTATFNVGEGFYDIVVRDANLCIASWAAQVEMVEPTQILFSYQVSPITTCNGDNTGAISISNVSGGSGEGYQYSISMPEVWGDNPVFTSLPGGLSNNYYIKVKDSHGCISTANNGNPINIDQPSAISFNVTTVDVTGCWYNENGQIRVINVTGGTGTKLYSIDGVTYGTNPYFNVGIGTYTVYVKDRNECIATRAVEILGPTPIEITSITPTDVSCFGSFDGRVDFVAVGGTGTLEYSIDGINYQSADTYFTGLGAGDQTLYVRDANGCILSQDFSIGHPQVLYFRSATSTNITCFGLTDGTITLVGSGGNGSTLQYSINGGITYFDNGGVFTGLSAGTYSPAVTDGSCSVLGENLTIVEPLVIAITSETSTDITCHNENNGTITVTATGGTGVLSYMLYKNSTLIETNNDGIFTGLDEGAYTVEVTDENDCMHQVTSILNIVNPAPVTFTFTSTNLSCYGYDDGTITLTPAGGSGVYEYSINGSDFATIPASIDNLAGGVYTIIVRDNLLCESASQDITIIEPDAIGLNPVVSPITCFGLNNGQIITTASGGSGNYQFRVNAGAWQTSGTFENLAAGNYQVEVFDGFCAIDSTVTILEPAIIQIDSIVPTNILCGGDGNGSITAYAQGGTGTLTYTLLDDTNTQIDQNTTGIFTGLNGGSYLIKVDDVNSCPSAISAAITILEPAVVSFTFVTTDIACNGNASGAISILAAGGNGAYEYSIDGADYVSMTGNTVDIDNLVAGTYSIIIRDGNGCLSASQDITINQNPVLTISLAGTNISCNGAADGAIVVTAAGGNTLSYEYQIDNGGWQASNLFNIAIGGTYYVEVRDASGCTVGDVVTILEPAIIQIDSIVPTNIVCGGDANGTITAYAQGGNGTLTYTLLDDTNTQIDQNTTGIFTGLNGGSYQIKVDDVNSCPSATSATITILEPAVVSFTFVTTDIACNGNASGTISILAAGGNGAYEYSINGADYVAMTGNTVDIDNLDAGTYSIIIRDGNGCLSASQDITINQNPVLTISLAGTNISCNGAADGAIVVTAAGGNTLSYEYQIDNGGWQASNLFNIAIGGTYYVEVRDASGCTVGDVVTIVEPSAITITDIIDISPTCQSLGSIIAIAEGGVEPLTYTLKPSNESNAIGLFEDLIGGAYVVEVVDASGCGPVSSDTIRLITPPTITIDNVATTNIAPCSGDANGQIVITATGGTPPLNYSIDGGTTYQTSNVFDNLDAGTYAIVVNDVNDCPQSTVATIIQPDPIVFDDLQVIQETAPNSGDGSIILIASGGNAPLTYTLKPNDISNGTGVFENLFTGNYYIEVTDANGCTKRTEEIRISGMEIIISHTDVTCYGAANGTVSITINGGFPPYTVACASIVTGTAVPLTPLDSLGSQFQATGLSVDTLLITISNSLHNVFPSRQIEITQPDTMIVNMVSANNPLCSGEENGSVIFNITGGTPDYTIAWADTSTTSTTISNLPAGYYSFAITDASGCAADTIHAQLISPDSIEVDIQVIQETGYAANNGIVHIDATGGTGAFTYILQPIGTTSTLPLFNSIGPGTYAVQVIDANGCTAISDEFVIRGTDIIIDTVVNASCYAANDGMFEFTVEHGFWPFNVSYVSATDTVALAAIDSVGRSFNVDSLIAGDYEIIVIDSLGNTINGMATILQPDSIVASISLVTTPICAGDSTAVVEFNIIGGTPNYTIAWADDTIVGTQITGLASGFYSFSITDMNGCGEIQIDTTISQPAPISAIDTTLIDPTCYGEAIGSISLTAIGGTGPLSYQLNNNDFDTIGFYNNLLAGNYVVTVTDSMGCSTTFNLELRDTSKIEINAQIYGGNMNCPYDTEGSISLNVTGGYGNYQYIWPSLDQSTDSVSGLTPGDYIIIVVDEVNCTVSDTFTVTGPSMFIFDTPVITQASCKHSDYGFDGTMSVSGNGGNEGAIIYSLLSPENDTITAGAPNFTQLAAGAYAIIAEDSHGCLYERLDTVPINPLYNFDVNVPDTVVCFANDVTLSGHMVYDSLFNTSQSVTYMWWNQGNDTNTPDHVGENYEVYLPESKSYWFKLRVELANSPHCYEEDWAEVNVYPEIGVHVPIYVSSVQNDTIISVLLDNEYNIDVNTTNVDYATDFQWYPAEMFTDSESWNTSILLTSEKYNELQTLYPNRFVDLKDPQTNRMTQFILADVVATTEVGCVDSLQLYTKIVNKLYLASVFSPNGDGRNDVWQIPKDYLFPDLEVEIFNRWGSMVWSAKGEKAARGWDGKTNGGKALPIGTYWYVIKFNLSQGASWKPETGSVTIVK